MPKKKATSGKLDSALEIAIAEELRAIRAKHKADVLDDSGAIVKKKGEFIYPLKERMEVIDRALKIEQLKLKVDDATYGTAFGGAPK